MVGRMEPSLSPAAPATRSAAVKVAVVIPCLNEAQTIGKVVRDFRTALPSAEVYVYDNGSTDDTVAEARAAGAVVAHEPLRGKGNVVRRMFSDVSADVFVMVDGDDTYDATAAPVMIQALLDNKADLITGVRVSDERDTYPIGHRFGNALLTRLVRSLFGDRCADLLSGYRVMTARFVKSFPALATGFEIETALTVHALELRLVMVDVPTSYRERPLGSSSKLRTVPDGVRVVRTIQALVRYERPLPLFGVVGSVVALISLVLGASVTRDYIETGVVERFPTAILAVGLMLTALLCVVLGLVLDSVARSRVEVRRLSYLSHLPPWTQATEGER
jgi:hypothetical protein